MRIIHKELKGNIISVSLDQELIWRKNIVTGVAEVLDMTKYEEYVNAKWKQFDYPKTPERILVKAKIKMKSTAEGGRQNGFTSGLRPNHVFEYEDRKPKNMWMGDIQFEGQELIMPGEEKMVIVRFVFHTPIEQYLHLGRKWSLHEGARHTGEAEIVEIKHPLKQ